MKNKIIVLIVGVVVLLAGGDAYADWRSYVWTYEYMTMPKGRTEIEYYLTEQQPSVEKARPNTWKHYFELEYGITNHWDVAMYQVFKQSNTSSESDFEYDGFKVRTRYRIAEKNKLPIDTLLYFEYIRNDDFDRPHILEGKLVFAKDLGDFNIAYNQIIKQELERGTVTEHEYAGGLSYAVLPRLKVGIESKGNYTEKKYYIGPSVSWAAGKFWAALGVVAGLNDKSDDLQARFILGIPL